MIWLPEGTDTTVAQSLQLDIVGVRNMADVVKDSERKSDSESSIDFHRSESTAFVDQVDSAESIRGNSSVQGPPIGSKANLSSQMQLTERQEMIRIVSNRLFFALVLLVVVSIIGALLIANGVLKIGATNLVVLLCGAIGGFISVQRRLKTLAQEDLVLLARSWVYVLLSPLVGSILATLLFFLFVSGLLTGDLFPNFTGDGDSLSVGLLSLFVVFGESYTDYAKLIFWCFLAGYSETFVTNIISNFEFSADHVKDINRSL